MTQRSIERERERERERESRGYRRGHIIPGKLKNIFV
jgi:hypothetical protein